MRVQIAVFLFKWIVLPYVLYWTYKTYVTPSMLWTCLAMMILIETSSLVIAYMTIRIASWFIDVNTKLMTRTFGPRIATWILG